MLSKLKACLNFSKKRSHVSRMASWLSKCDPNSYSNPEDCKIHDLSLHLRVDFNKRILAGYVDISFERKDAKSDALILDTRDLVIHNVRNRNTMKKMTYTLDENMHPFGAKLEIKLPKTVTKKYVLRIDYETSPKASGLQWLEPALTCGKKHPYLYSQCQAIHARSLVPCQDTPYAKTSYSASITVPSELTVLMSAIRDGEEPNEDTEIKTYKFVQKVPIPIYLIAIVVGDLESRKIGPRSHVWSEKELVEKAAEEFVDTETMIKTAEDLVGPYVWDQYDILVLPPSFPFGGMENPCLTFTTPALVVGDKSLVDVIAHEIAHSWTGNLVTNSNFEHFWLNEGFTMFLERKICGRLHNEARRHFDAIYGWKELAFCIDTMGSDNPLTKLVPDLTGVDPDDAWSSVPYEKGHSLLFYLEQLLGGPEVFEGYLKAYVEKFKTLSITTDDWKSFLYEYFHDKKDLLDKVDWNAWLYTPGMPPVKPNFDSTFADPCIKLCQSWVEAEPGDLDKFTLKDLEEMISPQIIVFLALLLVEKPLSEEKVEKMTETYGLEKYVNAEVRYRWILLSLKGKWKPIIPHATEFLSKYGRMKYVRPIYRALYEWEDSRQTAIDTYKKHSSDMMFVSANQIKTDLNL